MKSEDIKVGMLVRYADGWCSEGEKHLVHIVVENRLNPCTGEMTRWLIETVNSNISIANPSETVEDYMIEPVFDPLAYRNN